MELQGSPMKSRRAPAKRTARKAAKLPIESADRDLRVVLAAVEVERDNLSRAESLLRCLKIAMEYGGDSDVSPYYPDVAQIASDMMRKSINALDPLYLPNRAQNKVREGSLVAALEQLPCELPLLPFLARKIFPRERRFRLHRRDYSRRFSASDVSNSASASANISG
jgi:hypothetical protein